MEKLTYILIMWITALSINCQNRLTQKQNSLRASDNLVKQQVEFKEPGSSGMYLYALIADGKVIDTKKMILTK
jgi:hypothetical protein